MLLWYNHEIICIIVGYDYYTIATVKNERISLQKILLWYNREIICIIAGYGYYTTKTYEIEDRSQLKVKSEK